MFDEHMKYLQFLNIRHLDLINNKLIKIKNASEAFKKRCIVIVFCYYSSHSVSRICLRFLNYLYILKSHFKEYSIIIS